MFHRSASVAHHPSPWAVFHTRFGAGHGVPGRHGADTGTEERVEGQGGKLLTVTPARTFLSVAYPLNSPMFPGGSGGLLPELPGATAPCTLLFGDGPKRSRSPCPSEARDERSDSHDMREL